MKVIDTIALILVIIGAINWGLIGYELITKDVLKEDLNIKSLTTFTNNAGKIPQVNEDTSDFNLVDTIFGVASVISKIIYILVGISGLWSIKLLFGSNN